ncbi:Leucyl aminopeptidase yscIV [Yamadazyma tenuis]|uniref:Leukotriene A(4) hydrolase n=1 Tax=Candida tenuis (strain ATCC 10573 / BCRC 21748 / CBS 615 / JCM 9827 / NBRC 10315 / NRRL Y-1498 / VKM Y-70) TaxID=590646 RepID=G3B5C1_CANTC|nr:leukotriene A-4 hydrol [Yamadazyma tenuis ATCC 10573]EGV63182.1 leukotriene A-4 hydrol [Yamadazyma tenuis ATCC 10573]WEJ96995.1 Leucyl aminopeptidase yscIV [Yamadazyma tenuis]
MTGREAIQHKRPAISPELDPCTLSNYYDVNIVSSNLDLVVSFDNKTVSGSVTYVLKFASKRVSKLTLDCSYLDIKGVSVNDKSAPFTMLPISEPFGSPLEISLETIVDSEFSVSITYATTEKCTALQFINGDTGPYLFSQCQPIHARSLFPCFDTPGAKSPFKYKVYSPSKVLMSGLPEETIEKDVYYFNQPIPIPSYLVAIASGNIVSAPIGPRSSVYSEEPKIKECQWEFEQDMEDFIQVAEKLTFKYEWSKFDVLVLPSTFPYGGMENPNITFATPTLLCKDRSQVKVLAHELAHSWAGNLVTNCSWEHFWLNEGWTVYFERRILGAIAAIKAKRSGRQDYEEYGEKYRHFAAYLGWSELAQTIPDLAVESTSLIWNLTNQDPDDFYSRIPYDKGFTFLYYLENKLGGTKEFDDFIPFYFKKFRYQSIDSFQFIDSLYEFFVPKGKQEVLDSIDFEAWLFAPGLPEYQNFDTSMVDECTNLADKWISSFVKGDVDLIKATFDQEKDFASFDANQHLVFLGNLSKQLDSTDVDPLLVRVFPDVYPYYSESQNFEIIFNTSSLLIKYGSYSETDTTVQRFASWLHTVGRMKYVRPGYRLLAKHISRDFAIKTFEANDNYHPICKALVKKDLGI